MSRRFLLLCTISFLLFSNCATEQCQTSNPVFLHASPDSKDYRDELARQLLLEKSENLRYWAAAYWMANQNDSSALSTEFLSVKVRGQEICAELILDIKESRKGLENLLRKKLLGYRGAELKNLRFDVLPDSTGTRFIFKEVGEIVD